MIIPINETESLLLFIAKNCETLIDRTHTRPHLAKRSNLSLPNQRKLFIYTNF